MTGFTKQLWHLSIVLLPLLFPPIYNALFIIMVANADVISVYGQLVFVLSFLSLFVAVSDLGLKDYYLTQEGRRKNRGGAGTVFLVSIYIYSLLAITGAGYAALRLNSDGMLIYLAVVFELLAPAVLYKTLYYQYQHLGSLTLLSIIDLIIKSATFFIKIVVYYFFGLIESLMAASVILLVSYSILIYKSDCNIGIRFFHWCGWKKVLEDYKGWGKYTLSFFSFILIFGVDKILVEANFGFESLAVYSSAFTLFAFGQIGVAALWSFYMPKVSREDILLNKTWFYLFSGLGLLVMCGYLLFADTIYSVIYPSEFADGVTILTILAVYFLFRYSNIYFELKYVLSERYERFTIYRLVSATLFVVSTLLMASSIGIAGVAILVVISELLLLLLVTLDMMLFCSDLEESTRV